MPNWCENQLTVTSATPELCAYLKEHGLSFEKINPPAEPAASPDDPRFMHLLIAAWGTKWDLDENDQRRVTEELIETGCAYFDTAWNPPIAALEALSVKFPNDSFNLTYCELGNDFAGSATIEGGMSCDVPAEGDEVMRIASEVFGYEPPLPDEETISPSTPIPTTNPD